MQYDSLCESSVMKFSVNHNYVLFCWFQWTFYKIMQVSHKYRNSEFSDRNFHQHTSPTYRKFFVNILFPPTYLTNITTAALTHETLMIWRKVFGVFCFKIILISEDTSKFYDRKTWSSSEIGLVRDPEKSLNRRYRE